MPRDSWAHEKAKILGWIAGGCWPLMVQRFRLEPARQASKYQEEMGEQKYPELAIFQERNLCVKELHDQYSDGQDDRN